MWTGQVGRVASIKPSRRRSMILPRSSCNSGPTGTEVKWGVSTARKRSRLSQGINAKDRAASIPSWLTTARPDVISTVLYCTAACSYAVPYRTLVIAFTRGHFTTRHNLCCPRTRLGVLSNSSCSGRHDLLYKCCIPRYVLLSTYSNIVNKYLS